MNTTYCKDKCPFQADENSMRLSCEACKKTVLYYQIVSSKATNKFNCLGINNEVNSDDIIKLDSYYLVDKDFKMKFSLKLFNSFKNEINWLQVGVLGGFGVLIITVLFVVILWIVQNRKNVRMIGKNNELEGKELIISHFYPCYICVLLLQL
jgi:hypothetical protein